MTNLSNGKHLIEPKQQINFGALQRSMLKCNSNDKPCSSKQQFLLASALGSELLRNHSEKLHDLMRKTKQIFDAQYK